LETQPSDHEVMKLPAILTRHTEPVRGEVSERALVLGGGGVTGVAWEIGMLAGLAEAGINLSSADRVIGTSAGAIVAAQISSGATLEELYTRQLEPPAGEQAARIGARVLLHYASAYLRARGEPTAIGRQLGAASIRAAAAGRTPALAERLALISSRLATDVWPDRDLRVTAVNALTGAFRVFTGQDEVSLRDAVAASCAVPSVFPPVPIDTVPYIDGGSRSSANADLAHGCSRVVVLSPMPRGTRGASPQAQVDALAVPAVVVSPDRDALTEIGHNTLDPTARRGAAIAGRAQARTICDRVKAVWD
jgi:NTE family protein